MNAPTTRSGIFLLVLCAVSAAGLPAGLPECSAFSTKPRACKRRAHCAWDNDTMPRCVAICKKIKAISACEAQETCEWRVKTKKNKPNRLRNIFSRGECVADIPPLHDRDDDGIVNEIDACPDEAGDLDNLGCACDPAEENLLDYPQWESEAGFWFGEFSFYGGDGDPKDSSSWPYKYDHYWGFISMEIEGNTLKQRNVFVYPPQSSEWCDTNGNAVLGGGVCGQTGAEKVFAADQEAVDCDGNLAGNYAVAGMVAETRTTLIGEDALHYKVSLPEVMPAGTPASFTALAGKVMQSQLTTFPAEGVRVRTAQGFNAFAAAPGDVPSYASFYREYRLDSKETWLAKLAEVREAAQVPRHEFCGFDSSSAPASASCSEHFGFPMGGDEEYEEYEAIE